MRKDPKVRRLIATSVLLLCAAAAGSAAGSQAHADTASIVGIWTLNKDASDAPPERTNRDDRERGGGGAGHGGGSVAGFGRGGGRGGPGGADPDGMRRRIQAMRDILDAPERLTIAQTDSLVIITTGDGRTTRLSPDGKKIKDESTGFERKTRRDNGHLVSEITGGQRKIVETYAVDAEHHRLTVTLQIDNPRMPNGGVVHRVYDAEGTP
jgi:hypothetical protein